MKKQNSDRINAEKLLKKLQKSFERKSAESSEKEPDDAEDAAFRDQVSRMLDKLSDSPSKKAGNRKKSKKTNPPDSAKPSESDLPAAQDEPENLPEESVPEFVEEEIAEPAEEMPFDSKKQKQNSAIPGVILDLTDSDETPEDSDSGIPEDDHQTEELPDPEVPAQEPRHRTVSYRPKKGVTLPHSARRSTAAAVDRPAELSEPQNAPVPSESKEEPAAKPDVLPAFKSDSAPEKPLSRPIGEVVSDHVIVIPPVSDRTVSRGDTIVIRPRQTDLASESKAKATPNAKGSPARATASGKAPAGAARSAVRSSRGTSLPRQHTSDPSPSIHPSADAIPVVGKASADLRTEPVCTPDIPKAPVAPVGETPSPVKHPTPPDPASKRPSAFASRRAKKKRASQERSDTTAMITERTGLDEGDIELIFELGYENELGKLVGYETLKKLKYEHLRRARTGVGSFSSGAFGYRGKEYSSSAPGEPVLAAFGKDRKFLVLRTALLVLISVLLLPVDFPFLFGAFFSDLSAAHPYWLPLIGLILFAFAFWISFRHIRAGWASFLQFSPTPDSPIAVAMPLALIYSVLHLINAASGKWIPLNFASVTALLALSVCDAFQLADQMRTFRIFSRPGNKTVLEETDPKKKRLLQGKRVVKILNDDQGEQFYRVRTAQETVGFFHRVNNLSGAARPFSRLTVLLLIASFAAAMTASLWSHSGSNGVIAFSLALAFSLPAPALFLFFDSLRRANKRLGARGTALIGEESVREYGGQKTIIFPDTEVFSARRKAQVAVRDGDDFRRDFRIAGALFRKLSGTLEPLGQNAPGKKENDPTLVINHLTETGVDATVAEEKTRILAGDAAFLKQHGVRVLKESTDRSSRRGKQIGLLYVAIGGAVKLCYEIDYSINESFASTIRTLAGTETTLALYSCDPCLNDAFLRKAFFDEESPLPLRVIKPTQLEENLSSEVTDTGVISLSGSAMTAYPVRAASLITATRRRWMLPLAVSLVLGAVLAAAASVALPASLVPFLPLFAVAYRAVWSGITIGVTSFSLRNRAIFETALPEQDNEPSDASV